ncbi:MAG: hypothetical protein KKC80_05295 [Candidatus Margulisbacteria bacterium]|nr:hypothetical protein [Candidatus Margulisiibacteriota bacterium]MBU1616620.1 hypothetical protein [Candidatus Margulisiibacteriota bacterium]
MDEKNIKEMMKNWKLIAKELLNQYQKNLINNFNSIELEKISKKCDDHSNSYKAIINVAISTLGVDRYNQINDELNKEIRLV